MKKKVAILFGGRSAERDISIRTGTQILAHLNRTKYTPIPIEISREGSAWVKKLLHAAPDVVFLALHGPYGEDGTIQGMLEMFDIPYTGSGVLASALAMDKYRLCEFVRGQGIITPRGFITSDIRHAVRKVKTSFGFPCIVKPNQLGSSVGVTVDIRTEAALKKAVALGLIHDGEVLIEECIRGREITAPVIGNATSRHSERSEESRDPSRSALRMTEGLKALPLIESIPKSGTFYDYKSKYANGGSEHLIPARLSPAMSKKIKAHAIQVHTLIGARGVTRSDFILRGTTPYFLEINTTPGMTSTSLVPQSAEHAGTSFSELLDELIALAKK